MAKTNRDDKWQAEVNDQKMCKCTTNIIKPNTWSRKVGPWKRIPPTSLAWRRPLSPSLRELIARKSRLWTRYMETCDASIYKNINQFVIKLEMKHKISRGKNRGKWPFSVKTRSSAIAKGPRDASCQLKSCQLPRNSAETIYTTSPDQIDGMKLEI